MQLCTSFADVVFIVVVVVARSVWRWLTAASVVSGRGVRGQQGLHGNRDREQGHDPRERRHPNRKRVRPTHRR